MSWRCGEMTIRLITGTSSFGHFQPLDQELRQPLNIRESIFIFNKIQNDPDERIRAGDQKANKRNGIHHACYSVACLKT